MNPRGIKKIFKLARLVN